METSNRPQLAREFTTSIGITFPIVIDDQEVSGRLFDVQATPTTLMIDRDGQIIFRSLGFSPGKEKSIEAEIQYMLRSAS